MNQFDYPPSFLNPFGGNPLLTRDDVELALKDLVAPLERYRSPAGARIRLSAAAATFDQAAADFEGYARPLWGLAAAQAGGATWIDWEPIRRGLAAGTDPAHAEFWGTPGNYSQRLVELATVGFALRLAPDHLWHPLSAVEKEKALAYFLDARQRTYLSNNWKFFRLLLDMGLRAIGAPIDETDREAFTADIEKSYLGDGWYRDGPTGCVDHYAALYMHVFGLILASLDTGQDWSRYRERARQSAGDTLRWFANDGPALPFGRSMTYRFVAGAYFAAFALADEEVLPWGLLKGFYLRYLRWWSRLPIASSAGLLDVGYGYSNPTIADVYNSPQSSYWGLIAFLPLALPATHPFWANKEADCPARPEPAVQKHAGMIIANPPGDAIALVSGQDTGRFRYAAEKYAKFAYSARYGFSIESDFRRFDQAVLDNSLGFSRDGQHFYARQASEVAYLAEATLYSRWRPLPDIKVESWIYWDGLFHLRVHWIESPTPIMTVEGGFALNADGFAGDVGSGRRGIAEATSGSDHSAIFDLGSSASRRTRVLRAPPNTNIIVPRTVVPQLYGELPAGETLLICAVIAGADGAAVRHALATPPARPDIKALAELVADKGVDVTIWAERAAIEAAARRPMSPPRKK